MMIPSILPQTQTKPWGQPFISKPKGYWCNLNDYFIRPFPIKSLIFISCHITERQTWSTCRHLIWLLIEGNFRWCPFLSRFQMMITLACLYESRDFKSFLFTKRTWQFLVTSAHKVKPSHLIKNISCLRSTLRDAPLTPLRLPSRGAVKEQTSTIASASRRHKMRWVTRLQPFPAT